jgi:hypothetical protein
MYVYYVYIYVCVCVCVHISENCTTCSKTQWSPTTRRQRKPIQVSLSHSSSMIQNYHKYDDSFSMNDGVVSA